MPGDFQVGDLVEVTYVGAVYTARVVEDRGPVGAGGRRMLRIEIVDEELGDPPPRFEVPAERVAHIAA